MKKRITLLMCAFLAFSTAAFAQIKITGTVKDASDGTGIPFASVVVKGTTTGVSADADGKYSISVPNAKSVLVISSVGYLTQEITVGGQKQIDVALSSDTASLDEVMVVAYGSATKTSFTGSAGKVEGEKIELVPNTNPLNTLNGSTPGLRLTSALGQPGADATITVRGIGSINGNTDPLIVLDGIIFSGALSSIPAGDIESITVLKDAASTALYGSRAANGVIMITTKQGKGDKPTIQVKVAHGFVTREQKDYPIMDTKQYMETTWREYYNSYMVDDHNDAATAAAKASTNVVAFHNFTDAYMPWTGSGVTAANIVSTEGVYNPNATILWADDIAWRDAIEQVGQVQDYSVSGSGRTKNSTFFGSMGYTNQEGYIIGSGFERFSGRANVSTKKDWFKMGINASAQMSTRYGIQSTSQGDLSNPFHITRKIPPMYPIHRHAANGDYILDADGNQIYDFGEGYDYDATSAYPAGTIAARGLYTTVNSVKYCKARVNSQTRHVLNLKPYVELYLPYDLKVTVNGSIFNSDYKAQSATPYYAEKISGTTSSSLTITNTTTYALNELLSWNHSFGDHNLDVLVGHEHNQYIYYNVAAGMKDQIVLGSNYQFNNYTEINTYPSGYKNEYNTESYLGRVNYDFLSKYYLSASFRRDGSSRFYTNSRWGNFWSVGGSWIVSKEDFMKDIEAIDQLKLRASIGTVGSDDLGAYWPYMALYNPNQNMTEAGYTASTDSPGNQNLKWEINHNWDVALEFTAFKRRLTGSIEYFHRQTSNLLMDVTLPSSTGLTSYPTNDGGLLNHGLEFALGYDIIKNKKVSWNVGLNGSAVQNKITYLPIPAYTRNSSYNRVEQGHSVYEWWLYQWAGVDPDTGLNLFIPGAEYFGEDGAVKAEFLETDGSYKAASGLKDVNGTLYTTDMAKSKEDFSGSSLPKLYGGITTDLRVGNFSFNLNLYYQLGGYTYDRTYAELMYSGVNITEGINMHTDMLKAWKQAGDVTDFPILTKKGSSYSANTAAVKSTYWLTSTNMLEINSMMVAYDLPKKFCSAIKISGLKAYVSADHLAVLNTRQGLFANYSLSNYDSGGSRYNPARTITLGLNFTL